MRVIMGLLASLLAGALLGLLHIILQHAGRETSRESEERRGHL